MKLQESLLNTPVDLELSEWEEIGDSHHSTSINTPMSEDAFTKSDEEKRINRIPLLRNHESFRA